MVQTGLTTPRQFSDVFFLLGVSFVGISCANSVGSGGAG